MKIRSKAFQSKKPYKPKPFKIPDGFILVIDTREQAPLFTRTKGLISTVDTLTHGDYSIRGFESVFAIERKQTSDFFSYIGKERQRTVKKLLQLSQFEWKALVIEATYDDLVAPQIYTAIKPEVVRSFFVSLNVRYDIHAYLDRKRENLERWILDRAIKFYNIKRGL